MDDKLVKIKLKLDKIRSDVRTWLTEHLNALPFDQLFERIDGLYFHPTHKYDGQNRDVFYLGYKAAVLDIEEMLTDSYIEFQGGTK